MRDEDIVTTEELNNEIDEILKEKNNNKKKNIIAISACIMATVLITLIGIIVFTAIRNNVRIPKDSIYAEVIITKCDGNKYTASIVAFEDDQEKYEKYVDPAVAEDQDIIFTSDKKFKLGSKIGGYYNKGTFSKPYREIN